MPAVHHAIVHFTGRVQGVGFRYQTMQVAKEYDVSGCVQNLPDGRVLLEAEGSPEEVRGFVAAVRERMASFIRQSELSEASRSAQFRGFSMR